MDKITKYMLYLIFAMSVFVVIGWGYMAANGIKWSVV